MERRPRRRLRWTIASMMLAIALTALPLGGYLHIQREKARREREKSGILQSEYMKQLAKELASQPQPRRPIMFRGY